MMMMMLLLLFEMLNDAWIPISLYSNLLLFPFGAGISATPFSSVITRTRKTPPGVLGTGGSPGSDVTGGVWMR